MPRCTKQKFSCEAFVFLRYCCPRISRHRYRHPLPTTITVTTNTNTSWHHHHQQHHTRVQQYNNTPTPVRRPMSYDNHQHLLYIYSVPSARTNPRGCAYINIPDPNNTNTRTNMTHLHRRCSYRRLRRAVGHLSNNRRRRPSNVRRRPVVLLQEHSPAAPKVLHESGNVRVVGPAKLVDALVRVPNHENRGRRRRYLLWSLRTCLSGVNALLACSTARHQLSLPPAFFSHATVLLASELGLAACAHELDDDVILGTVRVLPLVDQDVPVLTPHRPENLCACDACVRCVMRFCRGGGEGATATERSVSSV